MLEYILIFVLNILILLLLFKKDDLYGMFLSQNNDQSKIKADKLTSFSAILFISIALFSTQTFGAGLIYTIGLLFTGEYIPTNSWVDLVILLVTGGVFYREYKKEDSNEGARNEGPRSATIFLSIVALLVGYKRLDPIYMGIAAFTSFAYLLINLCELKFRSFSDILLSYTDAVKYKLGAKMGPVTDPNINSWFSIVSFLIMFIIVATSISVTNTTTSSTTIALSLVSFSLWASTWFKYTDEKRKEETKGLKETMKKIIPAFFLIATIVQVIPFSHMATGLKWIFIVAVTLLSIFFLVNALQAKKPSTNTSANGSTASSATSSLASLVKEQFSTVPSGTYQVLGATIVAFASYFGLPLLYNFVNEFVQGGKVLLREPIHLDKRQVLSTYKKMNTKLNTETDAEIAEQQKANPNYVVKKEYNYRYGISCYIFVDSNNTNDYYLPILDYGGKPRVQYNGAQNSLQIIVLDDYETEKVVLTLPDFELQKWHHLALNYIGGDLDVFLDGELIKSVNNVVPQMDADSLISGSDNSEFVLNGGIKYVVYFDKPLTQTNLFFLTRK